MKALGGLALTLALCWVGFCHVTQARVIWEEEPQLRRCLHQIGL